MSNILQKLEKFYNIGKELPENFLLNYNGKQYKISAENYLWIYFQSFEHISQEKILYSVYKTAFTDKESEIDNCLGFLLLKYKDTFESLRILTRDRKYYMDRDRDFSDFLEDFRERISQCQFTSLIINDGDHRVILFIYRDEKKIDIYIYDPIEISEAVWKFFNFLKEKWNLKYNDKLNIEKREGTFCPIQPYTNERKFCIMWTNLWIYLCYVSIPEMESGEDIKNFINNLGNNILSIDKKTLKKILLGFTITVINKFQEIYSRPTFGKEFFFSESEERLKSFLERDPEWFERIDDVKARSEKIKLREGGERNKKDGEPCESSRECLSDYCRRCGKNKCCKPYPYKRPY